jgi:hypothetical protein
MKPAVGRAPSEADEHLQIQVPAITRRALGRRAVETREPIRVIALRALQAYGESVPPEAISDPRKKRSS